jgi:hypothetical protein
MEKLERHELFACSTRRKWKRPARIGGRTSESEKVYLEGMPASHFFVLLRGG